MKKIILINASPRKNKNSEQVAEHIKLKIKELSDAKGTDELEIKYMDLKRMNFIGCIDCGYCQKHRGCSVKDDIQYMYEEFNESDATIVVTPIYFDGTPWKLKALVDRLQAIYNSKYVLLDSLIDREKERRGFVVSIAGGAEYDTQFIGNDLVMKFMFRSINTQYEEHIKISNTDEKMAMENIAAINKIDDLLSTLI